MVPDFAVSWPLVAADAGGGLQHRDPRDGICSWGSSALGPVLLNSDGHGGRVLPIDKGTLLGTPNREPQEYSRNIIEW